MGSNLWLYQSLHDAKILVRELAEGTNSTYVNRKCCSLFRLEVDSSQILGMENEFGKSGLFVQRVLGSDNAAGFTVGARSAVKGDIQ